MLKTAVCACAINMKASKYVAGGKEEKHALWPRLVVKKRRPLGVSTIWDELSSKVKVGDDWI